MNFEEMTEDEFDAAISLLNAEDLARPHRPTYKKLIAEFKKLSDFDLEYLLKKAEQDDNRRTLDSAYKDEEEEKFAEPSKLKTLSRQLIVAVHEERDAKELRILISKISLCIDQLEQQ